METAAAVDKISDLQVLPTAAWKSPLAFRTVPTGPAAVNLTNQNRTDHLLQKPDISSCYRQFNFFRESLQLTLRLLRVIDDQDLDAPGRFESESHLLFECRKNGAAANCRERMTRGHWNACKSRVRCECDINVDL